MIADIKFPVQGLINTVTTSSLEGGFVVQNKDNGEILRRGIIGDDGKPEAWIDLSQDGWSVWVRQNGVASAVCWGQDKSVGEEIWKMYKKDPEFTPWSMGRIFHEGKPIAKRKDGWNILRSGNKILGYW